MKPALPNGPIYLAICLFAAFLLYALIGRSQAPHLADSSKEQQQVDTKVLNLDRFPQGSLSLGDELFRQIPEGAIEAIKIESNWENKRSTKNDDRIELQLYYNSSDEVDLFFDETYIDSGYGTGFGPSREYVGGDRHTGSTFKTDEVKLILPLLQKYEEWCNASAKEHLPVGIKKEIGQVGRATFTFITPDTLMLREFELHFNDVQQVVNAFVQLPSIRERWVKQVEINKANAKASDEKAKQEAIAEKQQKQKIDSVLK